MPNEGLGIAAVGLEHLEAAVAGHETRGDGEAVAYGASGAFFCSQCALAAGGEKRAAGRGGSSG